MRSVKRFIGIFVKNWFQDQVPRHSAAMAYYTIFSLPAFTFTILSVAGLIIGPDVVESRLFIRMREIIGDDVTDLIHATLTGVQKNGASGLLAAASIIILIVGALSVFREIQSALNEILNVEPAKSIVKHYIRSFVLSFLLLIITAVLLATAISSSAILQLISHRVGGALAVEIETLHLINSFVTWATMTVLFFLLYTILPARKLHILPSFVGAIVASTFLLFGTWFLTFFVTNTNIGQAYGVAASLLVLLFWIFYSSNVFLLGAEIIDTWEQMKKRK